MFPIDLGSIADWVGAIGGLLAVVASVLAWKSSDRINKRMLALEEKREADKRLLRVRGQAESVFAAGVNLPERDGAGKWGIYLFNGSDQPIFDITVESRRLDNGSKNATCEIGLLPPGVMLCLLMLNIVGVRLLISIGARKRLIFLLKARGRG